MISNVLIVGLGGVGSVYASKIKDAKILLDKNRLKKYINTPTEINGQKYKFDYVTSENPFNADLIIIATKFYNLDEVLENIKKFVSKNTIIISLLNGISSEEIISKQYSEATVVQSYLICNSIIRQNRKIIHDDFNKIVIDKNQDLEQFFKVNNINYEISKDIKSDLWQKFMLNIIANQLSAVTFKTFGEMNSLSKVKSLLPKILEEVIHIAKAEGINTPETLAQQAITTFKNMAPYGKTSMLQDIENNKQTEIDAFAGTVIKLGEKYNIPTPYNNVFYFLLSQHGLEK